MTFSAQPQIARPLYPSQYVPDKYCVLARPIIYPKKATNTYYKPVAFGQVTSMFNPHIPLVEATRIPSPRQVNQAYDCRTGLPFFFVSSM